MELLTTLKPICENFWPISLLAALVMFYFSDPMEEGIPIEELRRERFDKSLRSWRTVGPLKLDSWVTMISKSCLSFIELIVGPTVTNFRGVIGSISLSLLGVFVGSTFLLPLFAFFVERLPSEPARTNEGIIYIPLDITFTSLAFLLLFLLLFAIRSEAWLLVLLTFSSVTAVAWMQLACTMSLVYPASSGSASGWTLCLISGILNFVLSALFISATQRVLRDLVASENQRSSLGFFRAVFVLSVVLSLALLPGILLPRGLLQYTGDEGNLVFSLKGYFQFLFLVISGTLTILVIVTLVSLANFVLRPIFQLALSLVHSCFSILLDSARANTKRLRFVGFITLVFSLCGALIAVIR